MTAETVSRLTLDDIADAACALLADEGIGGLSLRRVAARVGTSLGGVSYHAGNKRDLVARMVQDRTAAQALRHRQWLDRCAPLDVAHPDVLAAVIAGFLDDAALRHRISSLAGCELVADAARDPAAYDGMAGLIGGETAFWQALLGPNDHDAMVLGEAIACYCRDELPFTLALVADPDYRLLRAGAIARLCQRFAPVAGGFAVGLDGFAAALPGTQDGAGARRAELSRAIAAVILRDGVAAVTHRGVAAQAQAPHSTIAHHFPRHADLLQAGIAGLYRQIAALRPQSQRLEPSGEGMSLMLASHAGALAGARDAALAPLALDLRRRRAELARGVLAQALDLPLADDLSKGDLSKGDLGEGDLGALQAALMVLVGSGIASHATLPDNGAAPLRLQDIVGLRRG